MKLKAVLKDVARIHNVPVYEVNYINKIIDDDSMDYTGLFQLAYTNKRVKEFIMNYPQVIEDIRTLMGQPRSSSIHASAIIITPETKDGKTMECFDYLPIKKIDDILDLCAESSGILRYFSYLWIHRKKFQVDDEKKPA